MFIGSRRKVLLSALGVGLLLPALLTAVPLTIEGRIHDATGEPLAAARVELCPRAIGYEQGLAELASKLRSEAASEATGQVAAPPAIAVTRSDRRGAFHLTAPAPGVWDLWVSAPGYVPVRYKLAPLVSAIQVPVVRLVKEQPLRVRIVGPEGQSIAGAKVKLESRDDQLFESAWRIAPQAGVSDVAGLVRLRWARPFKPVLTAAAVGLAPSDPVEVQADTEQVQLKAGARRRIAVRDRRGRPLAGVLARVGKSSWPMGVSDEAGNLEGWAPLAAGSTIRLFTKEGRYTQGSLAAIPESWVESPLAPEPQRFTLPEVKWAVGRVVAAKDNRPLAGALILQPGNAGQLAWSDSQGRYRLAIALTEGYFSITKAGYLTAYGQLVGPIRREVEVEELALVASTYIEGRVVDEEGQPVGSVVVDLAQGFSFGGGRFGGHGGYADGRGQFRLDRLQPSSDYTIHVDHPGFAPLYRRVTTTVDTPTTVEMVLLTGHLGYGRVLDLDESPVAGAQVYLVKRHERDSRASPGFFSLRSGVASRGVVTDGTGRFEFAELGAGHYDLLVGAVGFAPLRVPRIEVPAQPGSVDLGTVLLGPGAAVEGTVVDPQGEPIAGAQVTVDAAASGQRPLAASQIGGRLGTVTDEAGFFRIEDLSEGGKVPLRVERSGFLTETLSGVEVPPIDPVTVVLRPTARLTGRVVDEEGAPVARAHVIVSGGSAAGFSTDSYTRTQQDGSFELEDVTLGILSLKAWAEGYLPTLKTGLEVAVGRDLDKLELVLDRGATIVGRVTTAQGEPVANANVSWVRDHHVLDNLAWIGGAYSSTDKAGEYRLAGIPLGLVSIEVAGEGHRRGVKDLQVEAGENRLDLVLDSSYQVSGRVVDSGGRPVVGARVVLLASETGWNETDADGNFTVAGVADGHYQLVAEHDTQGRITAPELVEVSGANVEGLEVLFAEGAKLVGQLSGLEVEELWQVNIQAFNPLTRETAMGEVDYQGRYRIAGLTAGDWNVVASHTASDSQVRKLVVIDEGQRETTLDLAFGGGLTLSGIVVRGEEPLVGQQVLLVQARTVIGSSKSDRNGRFKIAGLAEGWYHLTVLDQRSGQRHTESLDLNQDRDLRIEIVGAPVAGRVVNATDLSALEAVEVSAKPVDLASMPNGWPMAAGVLSDADGQFNLGDLSAGRWRIAARLEGFEQAEAEIVVSSTPVDSVRLALRPGGGLTFYLSNDTGMVARQVQASVVDRTGRTIMGGSYTSREGGRVHIASVPDGHWQLLIQAGGSAVARVPVVLPGVEPRIALLPGARLELTVADLVVQLGHGQLQVVDSEGRPFRAPRGAGPARAQWPVVAGRASLASLPPGNWRVVVISPDGGSWSAGFTAVAGQTVRVRIE